MDRASLGQIDPDRDLEVPIASPEDVVLSKLEWYRLGGEQSERQWDDVTRVMKILGDQAEIGYMMQFAEKLRINDLLKKLISEISN